MRWCGSGERRINIGSFLSWEMAAVLKKKKNGYIVLQKPESMTKHSKPILAFVLFSIALNYDLSAQIERSIEVIASDTVFLKPTEFIYEVGVDEQQIFRMPNINKEEMDTVAPISLAQLAALLTKNNFTFWETPQRGYTINENLGSKSVFDVRLNSEEQLKRLFDAIKNLKRVSGMIKEIKYESISAFQAEMDKRLYSAAVHEADLLASAAHRSVGQLISIEELKGILDNSFIADEISNKINFSAVMGLFSSSTDAYKKKVIKRLLFKFQLL
jgi:hypothetical protein